MRLVPSDAFAAVRTRWLPLVALLGLIGLMIVAAVSSVIAFSFTSSARSSASFA